MELRLTEEEHNLLVNLLQEQQKHLIHQISKADHYEFKVGLRDQCDVLESIVAKLQAPVSSAA
jgi:hypothetical protein